MRRFFTSVVFLFFAIPFGASISGCHHAVAPTYCNGENSGVEVGQLTTLDLEPRLTGISLNQGQIGQASPPSGKDCKGNGASGGNPVFGTSNITLVDVQPTTGRLCGGSWNRNTGGGIADFTYCIPTSQSGIAYLTASAGGVVSNPIPIFIHPVVTSIVLGPASTNCALDPASNCLSDPTQANGCTAIPPALPNGPNGLPVTAYDGLRCISQGFSTQLVARIYGAVTPFAITSYTIAANIATFQTSAQSLVVGEPVTLSGFPISTFLNGQTATVQSATATSFVATVTGPATVAATTESGTGTGPTTGYNNISCVVGPPNFNVATTAGTSGQNASVVSIDNTQAVPGLATAAQPGSTTISAGISQASSTAGFFSTCPPKSIIFSAAGAPVAPPTAPITVNQNSTATFVTTVTDTNNNPITSLPLTFISTTPTTIPIASNTITPPFPGAATITAICQPPACNSSPFNEIGAFGNGTPVTSNPVQINAVGTNFNTVLYMASSNSQYLLPFDFTLTTQAAPIRLPYAPNSFQLSTDLTTIYMGTPNEIMAFSTLNNTLAHEDTSLAGTVLSVSPDSTTVIVTDPVRQLIYLYSSTYSVTAEYGGVGVSATWSPDSNTVYIPTTDGRLLVYSRYTGWTAIPLTTPGTNVAVTIPNAGIYMAQTGSIDLRTNCPATTFNGTGLNTTTSNVFFPDLGPVAVPATNVTATNDGAHILAANATKFTDIATAQQGEACPVKFTSTPGNPIALGVTATTVNQLLATSDSAYAFVTYTGGTSSTVPEYIPSTVAGGSGTLTQVPLKTYTTAPGNGTAPGNPITGVISADNNIFYVTGGLDGLVHRLTRGTTGFTDSLTPINPQLPLINGGGFAIPNFLAQKPRKSTT